ncbi:MAG: major capsid protein, partial [Chloroflexota bacterium]|nr:major capsid protein [Chloroflexota bacterium]
DQIEALAALVAQIAPHAQATLDERAQAAQVARDRIATALGAMAPPTASETPPAAPEPAPVATTASGAPVRVRPAAIDPPQPAGRSVSLVAAAGQDFIDGGGIRGGAPFQNMREMSRAMTAARENLGPRAGQTAKAYVARVQRDPRPVVLGDDGEANAVLMDDLSNRVRKGQISMTAAAGPFCAPAEVIYDYCDMEVGGLWVLPTVDSPRGRRSYPRAVSLANISGDWLAVIGSQDDPKPCYVVPCGDDDVFSVTSYPTCLRFDNFTGRFYPERVSMISRQTLRYHEFVVQAALLAEARALAEITNVQDSGGGFVIALVRALRHAASYLRSKHYLSPTATLDVVLPAWVPNAVATDIVTRDATLDLAVVDARVRAIVEADNINVQWINGDQPLPEEGWEAVGGGSGTDGGRIEALMYVPGGLLRLDGGTLDLGVQRDSTRNAANQFDTFVEEWAGIARPCFAPLRITNIKVCTSGGTGDREAILCGSGS